MEWKEQSEGSGNGRGFEGLGQTLGPGRGVELTQRRIPPPTVTRGLLVSAGSGWRS